ncbi:MAG TPA: hypothetical protein VHJ19_10450, partial [Gammaproteobacteria bacterium]|nr:hypothetical protein [Gammaproteobacteria bacterium]
FVVMLRLVVLSAIQCGAFDSAFHGTSRREHRASRTIRSGPLERAVALARRPANSNLRFNSPVSAQVRDAIIWLEASSSRWLLLSGEALKPCFLPGYAIDMGIRHRQRWWLLNRSAIAPRCLDHGD